jgi:hypothetical protein
LGERRFHSYTGGANSSSITSSGYVLVVAEPFF